MLANFLFFFNNIPKYLILNRTGINITCFCINKILLRQVIFIYLVSYISPQEIRKRGRNILVTIIIILTGCVLF